MQRITGKYCMAGRSDTRLAIVLLRDDGSLRVLATDFDYELISTTLKECRQGDILPGIPVELHGRVFEKFVHVRSQMADKIGAAFATSADPTGGKETTILSILEAMLIYGMIVVGDPMDATGHYGVACVEKPDGRTQGHAVKLGRRVAELARKLRG